MNDPIQRSCSLSRGHTGLVLISGIADAEPYGEDPMKGVFSEFLQRCSILHFWLHFVLAIGVSPVSSVQFDATAGAALGMLVLGILPLSSLSVEPIDFQLTWPGHGWLILLAVLSQVGGWLAVAYALPRLPAAHTSFAILLQPVLTLLWGFLILNQDGTLQQPRHVLGASSHCFRDHLWFDHRRGSQT